MAEAGETQYSDPFAALEPGEYGADLGVRPDDIAEEFANEDLQLERVYVDERGVLRRIEDDTFVRHVVEGTGTDSSFLLEMLEEVPAHTTDDQLLASALFLDVIPPSFVRLDDPDGENVVTKVADLDIHVSKYELLVSLGDATRHEDFSGEDLATMEGALDTLADLEDEAGIDEWIEATFF